MKELYDYCRRDQNSDIVQLFKQHLDLDLTYKKGIYFRFAIKHNNVEMLKMLLEYYEKTQLQGDFGNQYAIPLAKQKLQTILQDAIKSFDISEEVQKVLNQYLSKEEDSDLEQELGDFGDIIGFNFSKIDGNDPTNEHHDKPLIGDKFIDSY